MSRLTLGLIALRAAGVGAVLLLLANPALGRWGRPGHSPPLVLLDASLSMAGAGGTWRTAVDSARALSRGGVIWRFGDLVTAFDTTPPAAGTSRVGPALAAAAGRGGPVVIITDGAITDVPDLPADLRRRAHVVVLPRPAFHDAFVAAVDGPRRVSVGDTVRLKVAYGVAGPRPTGGSQRGQLVVERTGEGPRLAALPVVLPESGLVSTEIVIPAARLALPGFHVLTVRLEGVPDAEPRDDARQLVLEVSAQPSVVVLAAPPDWESRFLARTLEEVARVPVRVYDETEPGLWRESRTLTPTAVSTLQHAVQAARLLVTVGDPQRVAAFRPRSAALLWNTAASALGDWYVSAPPLSLLAGDLSGIPWDSLPPVSAGGGRQPGSDSGEAVVLQAQLGRRGAVVPVISLAERGGKRRVMVNATGLWRWGFRGGVAEQAYRGLLAALANWLLEQGGGRGGQDRVVPLRPEVANGLPLQWRWDGRESPSPNGVALRLANSHGVVTLDTLHFDAMSRAELRLPPGEYRYEAMGGGGQGVVVVEQYSDEWRPATPTLVAQPGSAGGEPLTARWRDRWWLFVVAIAAFTGEWVWRRRQGLP